MDSSKLQQSHDIFRTSIAFGGFSLWERLQLDELTAAQHQTFQTRNSL